jgi:hypothetical protein
MQVTLPVYDRYAYVRNSPVNFVDPSGHDPNHCGLVLDGQCIDTSVKGLGRAPKSDETTQITEFPVPEGLSEADMVGYNLLMTLINQKDAWWWDDGIFTLDEAIAILLFWEGAITITRNGNESWKLPSKFVTAITYKWQKNCGGGWNSVRCIKGFWSYFSYGDKLASKINNVMKYNLNDPQVFGGDVYIRSAKTVLNSPPIPISDNVPQGWVNIYDTQIKAYKYAKNLNVDYTGEGMYFIVLTAAEQKAFCNAMGMGNVLCNVTAAP